MKLWKLLLSLVIMGTLLLAAGCGNGEEAKEKLEDKEKENGEETAIITLFFLEQKEKAFHLAEEEREVQESEATPQTALELLLEGPESEEVETIIHEETELIDINVEDGICYANFTEELTQGAYGSEIELNLVKSIVHTLVQFDEIDKVQFKIEGEIPESIAGHIYTGEPLDEEL
ncbi:GerMN domain-containing protein [Natranaerobius thermophilus]|uniref:Spore germination protein-like protein n=1 Tax=Natranaerobius thermophilus (strain ATCC BAA-1301 / DSM 18059 / JW/NM-WN-LF) TaxID=457570 RepID=B2A8G6_NATTJ|nr:GerMN domain-containing protein [Natranaerobius thermophilus]ACB85850.1 spore germination protein-like protein [Natranaerobius thermophilus JW/NM-WN-LF]